MTNSLIFMFSGQGSQYYQMGKFLYLNNEIFRHELERLDRLYLDIMGKSLIKHLYESDYAIAEPFKKTLFTHPAIFMVEYALFRVFQENNIQPNIVLGASLGEFAAAVAANIMPVESILQLVIKQAQLLEEHCQSATMLAILHPVSLFDEVNFIKERSELAAINFPSHFIISGLVEDLEYIQKELKTRQIASQLLPISHGFHSHFIDPAEGEFKKCLRTHMLKLPEVPYLSCVNTLLLTEVNYDHLWDIIRRPIMFEKTIQTLEKKQPWIYIDLGPSGTMATFVKYNLMRDSQSKFFAAITPFKNDILQFEKLIEELKELQNR